jgi:putative colanic acid biosynthesis acetyltransferase WcaF
MMDRAQEPTNSPQPRQDGRETVSPGAPPVDLFATEAFPYSRSTYVGRFMWSIVWCTLWQVCWARIPILRTTILRLFGARLAGVILAPASLRIHMPWALSVGRGCALGARTHLYNLGGLSIGDQTVLSQDVYVCGGTHDYTDPTYPLIRKKITIGSYVWIAAGAFIGPGVTIGEGAVVGARAVVTRDVEPWTVVAGNPAKMIKRRVMRRREDARPTEHPSAGPSGDDVNPPPGTSV